MDLNIATQPSWNHAFVTFNNQNTVLMTMVVPELLCFLHDNRIFAFATDGIAQDCLSEASAGVQNMILSILTTPKYRAMSSMYLIFRLLDNLTFLLIIVLSLMKLEFKFPTLAELALFSAIGIEIFYDIMLYTHKYWILNRLSVYIGLVLYMAYAGIIFWKKNSGAYNEEQLQLVVVVLSIRFVVFVLEELVDIAIDGELHNDLLKLHKKNVQPEIAADPDNDTVQQNQIDVRSPLLSKGPKETWWQKVELFRCSQQSSNA